MSDMEQVQYFNPLLILIWILQLIMLAMDYSQDQRVSWSIPVIGSFLLIQIYMIWKTNYDQMKDEQRTQRKIEKSQSFVELGLINHPNNSNENN